METNNLRIAWQVFPKALGAEVIGPLPTVGERIRVRLTSGALVPARIVKVLGTLSRESQTADGIQPIHTIVFQA